MIVVKKYGNRRLYDTDESRYVTIGELTEKIRRGADVQVVDAKTGADLTQATLLQIILETKAARFLPAHLLARLIRMQDDALGEFFSRYVSSALEGYLAAKQGLAAAMPMFPMGGGVPMGMPYAQQAFARMMQVAPWGIEPPPPPPAHAAPREVVPPPPPPPPPAEVTKSDVDALRDELDALRRELRKKRTTKG